MKETSMRDNMNKRAIIDIGSNTIRLVIYQRNEFGIVKETENIKTVVRLRHYLNENRILEKEGIQRLVDILKGFKGILTFHNVDIVKCVATATVRQAINQEDILAIVKTETGFNLTILSEKEEAYFGYFAVIHTTPIDEGVTIDIGGGSTEITYFKNRKLIHYHSFPFGVVSLKEHYLSGELILGEEKQKLVDAIKNALHSLSWLKGLKVPIVAIGGSARNVAQIDQNRKDYPVAGIHQYTMKPADITEILRIVEQSTISQLEKLEGLSSDRADIIYPALMVFVLLCDYVQSERFMLSRKGLRDGVLLKEYEKRGESTNTTEIIQRSIHELIYDYQINREHAEHVKDLAMQIYQQIVRIYELHEDNANILKLSATVYYLGKYVDSDVSSQHTFYLLANKPIEGLEHKDRLKLALIASFKNNGLLKQYSRPFAGVFNREELYEIRMAGAITKLAAALDASKRGIIKKVLVTKEPIGNMVMTLHCKGDVFVEKYQAQKHIRQLEKTIKQEINLKFITK